jgi:hypothetical protein
MLNSINSRFAIQKFTFFTLIISFLVLIYLVTVINPIGQLQYFGGALLSLFVFLASLIYNISELYTSFIKKEILTVEQSYQTLKYSLLVSLNIIALIALYQTNTLTLFIFLIWSIIFLTIIIYGKSN